GRGPGIVRHRHLFEMGRGDARLEPGRRAPTVAEGRNGSERRDLEEALDLGAAADAGVEVLAPDRGTDGEHRPAEKPEREIERDVRPTRSTRDARPLDDADVRRRQVRVDRRLRALLEERGVERSRRVDLALEEHVPRLQGAQTHGRFFLLRELAAQPRLARARGVVLGPYPGDALLDLGPQLTSELCLELGEL